MLESPKTSALRSKRPEPEPQDDSDIDIFEIVATLWRGKWIILACAAIAVLIGAYKAYVQMAPTYRAAASVVLQVRNQQIVDIQSVMSGVSTDWYEINTELEVITSRGLLAKVARDLDLTQVPVFNWTLPQPRRFTLTGAVMDLAGWSEDAGSGIGAPAPDEEELLSYAVDVLSGMISASNMTDTYIFEIAATTEDPGLSQLLANAVARAYIQDQIDVKFQATENAVAWLSERVVELEADLEARERRIQDKQAELGVLNTDALDAMNLQLRDRRNRLADTQAAVLLQEALIARVEDLRLTGTPVEIAEELQDPALMRLAPDAMDGEGTAQSLFDARVDLALQRLKTNLDRQRQQVETLDRALRDLSAQADAQAEQLVVLQQLERETAATRTLYETFLTRLKETSVQRGLQQADSRILSEATPGYYVAPRKSRILSLHLALGLLAGIGLVLLRQYLHKGFRTAEDLEAHAGLPVLGQIPVMPVTRRRELIDFLNDRPTSAGVEAVRNLRTSILLSRVDNPPQVILSASSVPGEGKTTMSIAMAHNLAGLGKRVMLIEADIRRRAFGEYFDVSPAHGGLITAMTGEQPLDEVIFRDPRMPVDILVGEGSNVNAADLFSSERFAQLMTELRQRYDFIIIDTPPVLVVPDARVVGQHADAIFFSVAWDKTTRGQVTDALRQFSSVNVRVAGLVLGKISAAGMRRYGYGDKYGAYSSYGKAYYDV